MGFSQTPVKKEQESPGIVFLSYFSFLPLIGIATAGFAIILAWEKKIKSRVLVTLLSIFGLFAGNGILASMLLYPSLMKSVTHKRLATIERRLESFKEQNGRYPENLEELKKNDPDLNIIDPSSVSPMMQVPGEGRKKFQYRKLDHGYRLNSVGSQKDQ